MSDEQGKPKKPKTDDEARAASAADAPPDGPAEALPGVEVVVALVSVSQAHLLTEALQSLAGQDGGPIGVLVVDPASTDGAEQVAERAARAGAPVRFLGVARSASEADVARRSFSAAQRLFPDMTIFGWTDPTVLWSPFWRSSAAHRLAAAKVAAVAPRLERLDFDGALVPQHFAPCESSAKEGRAEALSRMAGMPQAGFYKHALYRSEVVRRSLKAEAAELLGRSILPVALLFGDTAMSGTPMGFLVPQPERSDVGPLRQDRVLPLGPRARLQALLRRRKARGSLRQLVEARTGRKEQIVDSAAYVAAVERFAERLQASESLLRQAV